MTPHYLKSRFFLSLSIMRCNIQSVKSTLRSVRPLNDPYGSNELNKPLTDRYNAGVLDNPQVPGYLGRLFQYGGPPNMKDNKVFHILNGCPRKRLDDNLVASRNAPATNMLEDRVTCNNGC